MAERYAVASGNWSATATWDGGTTLPTASDDVYANGFTVTINQDVTVLTLNTRAGTTAIAGGVFQTSGARTVTADCYAGSSSCLSLTSSTSSILIGDSYGSNTTSSRFGVTINSSCVQNGNAIAGSQSSTYGSSVTSGGVLNGNATGGSGSSAHGANLVLGSTMTGNATGGSGTNAAGVQLGSGSFLNGNATAGTTSGAHGAIISGGYMYGNAFGGGTSGAHGINIPSQGCNVFVGDVTGGTVSGSYGISLNNGSVAVVGTATGTTSGAFGVYSSSTVQGVVTIETESGSYAKSISTHIDTTSANIPWSAGGPSVPLIGKGLVF